MRRGLAVILVALLGCTATNADTANPSTTDLDDTTTSAPPPRSSVGPTVPSTTATSVEPERPGPFIVVMPDGLPDDFRDTIINLDGVTEAAVIRSGQMQLTGSADSAGDPVDQPAAGFVIPIEATVFDVAAAAAILSPELAGALEALQADEVLLSRSSAALRRLPVGGTMSFGSDEFRVAAVVDDEIAGTTEAIFISSDSGALPSTRRRAAVVTYDGDADALEAAVMARFDQPVRVFDRRGGGSGDRQRVTLPQLTVKQLFGEFAYRPRSGGRVEIDPGWTEANLVTVDVPLLGEIRCHRVYAELLTEVMTSLVADGLDEVIDSGAYQGCWNPRFIAGSTRLSRHAWGIAADINFGNALDAGPGSPVNEELLARMSAAGTTSGHLWTIPDPGHFEYVGLP